MKKDMTLQRMTRQRKILMEVLDRKNWHPTAEEIYGIVRMRAPKISLGTVYRNLDILTREGIIQKVETSGTQRRYDGNPKPHFHIQCLECLEVWDIDVSEEQIQAPSLVVSPDFFVTGYRLVFEGYCKDCHLSRSMPEE